MTKINSCLILFLLCHIKSIPCCGLASSQPSSWFIVLTTWEISEGRIHTWTKLVIMLLLIIDRCVWWEQKWWTLFWLDKSYEYELANLVTTQNLLSGNKHKRICNSAGHWTLVSIRQLTVSLSYLCHPTSSHPLCCNNIFYKSLHAEASVTYLFLFFYRQKLCSLHKYCRSCCWCRKVVLESP